MNESKETNQLRTAVAILRITLGIILLVTWYDNLTKGLYTADGLTGFFNWLFDAENGNGSSLVFYQTFLETIIVPIAGPFATLQLIAELLIGLSLLFGVFTRLFGIIGMFFFVNLFFSYFGGHEWIWTYVLLFISTLTVTLGAAGRKWGVDQWILKNRDEALIPILC